jgi:hypothetical protein
MKEERGLDWWQGQALLRHPSTFPSDAKKRLQLWQHSFILLVILVDYFSAAKDTMARIKIIIITA